MYYITKKNSETGKKFATLLDMVETARLGIIAVAEKYGFDRWYYQPFCVVSSPSRVLFPKNTTVDTRIWKNANKRGDEWAPRRNTKIGKAIFNEMDALPIIRNRDLNMSIGWKDDYRRIGLQVSNKYYGFTTEEFWNIKEGLTIPDDCEEVTFKRFKELFPKYNG